MTWTKRTRHNRPKTNPIRTQFCPRPWRDPPLLYQLEHDPPERYNIAADNPEIVADLLKEVKIHKAGAVPVTNQLQMKINPRIPW
jgi:hypothetical protein